MQVLQNSPHFLHMPKTGSLIVPVGHSTTDVVRMHELVLSIRVYPASHHVQVDGDPLHVVQGELHSVQISVAVL